MMKTMGYEEMRALALSVVAGVLLGLILKSLLGLF